MLADNDQTYELVEKLLNGIEPDSTVRSLNATHLEAINMDVDGIKAHTGIDGDIYYEFCHEGKKLNLCRRNYTRMIEFVFKALSMNELCSLLGEKAPAEGKKVKRVSFFTDYCYWSEKSRRVCGDMGYSIGGDYEESERCVKPEENEQDVLTEIKENIIKYVREMEDEQYEGNFDIYTIERHTYEVTLDEDGDEIEKEETREKEILVNIFNCTREKAKELNLENDYPEFNTGENIFIKE